MKTINIYAHAPGPVSAAFLQVFSFTDISLVEVPDQKSADIVLLTGAEDFRTLYNEEQIFCVLLLPRNRLASNQPENVCVLDTLGLFGEKGVKLLLEKINWYMARKTESTAPKVELPRLSDIASFKKRYSVLVIDDTEHNLSIAESVLEEHSVTVVGSLRDAMVKLGQKHFDAVLTDMEMPPDKYYSSLDLNNYAVDEKVSYGFAVVLEMTQRGLPVAVVTDGNHHLGWVSAMFDHITSANVNGQKVLFFNNIGKRWDTALKRLMEE